MRFLILLVLLATGGAAIQAALPSHFAKNVASELKKVSKTGHATFVEIKHPEDYKLQGNFYQINGNNLYSYVYAGRIYTHRTATGTGQSGEFIDYFILYDINLTVMKVKVTRFLGQVGQGITTKGWLSQFIGFKPGKILTVGRDVDAISGATNSVNQFTFDVQRNSSILAKLVQK